jgi:predicted alpha/beta-hydrolase family hydrolase
MPGVRGLVFLGFPLHAAGRPGSERAAHLLKVDVPLLFVQGKRDRLADIDLMRTLVDETLPGDRTLIEIDSGDHSLRVPKRTGLTTDEVLADVAARAASWMASRVETVQD